MIDQALIPAVSIALFVVMWLCSELGRWYGQRELKRDPDATHSGTGVIEGGVFGLLGLLLAFAFSGAATRFDTRRQIIVQEANAIGTAWLRIDLLPSAQQPGLRELYRQYLDARLGAYDKLPDMQAVSLELNRATKLQGDIWIETQKAVRISTEPQTAMLVFPSVNDMFDASVTRDHSTLAHTPWVIVVLLFISAMLTAVLAAYSGADRPRRKLHLIVCNAMIAMTICIIMDLDYPRVGLIRLDASDRVLADLRKSMN